MTESEAYYTLGGERDRRKESEKVCTISTSITTSGESSSREINLAAAATKRWMQNGMYRNFIPL